MRGDAVVSNARLLGACTAVGLVACVYQRFDTDLDLAFSGGTAGAAGHSTALYEGGRGSSQTARRGTAGGTPNNGSSSATSTLVGGGTGESGGSPLSANASATGEAGLGGGHPLVAHTGAAGAGGNSSTSPIPAFGGSGGDGIDSWPPFSGAAGSAINGGTAGFGGSTPGGEAGSAGRASGGTSGLPALGLLGFAETLHPEASSIALRGDYAFVGSRNPKGSLETFVVSTPSAPFRTSALVSGEEEIYDLATIGGRLFAANDCFGLTSFTASASPEALLAIVQQPPKGYAHNVELATVETASGARDYALVGYIYDGQLLIHDLTDPDRPGTTIQYLSAVSGTRDTLDVATAGDKAYVLFRDSTNRAHLEILSLSALPEVPQLLGSLELPTEPYGAAGELRIVGNMLYYSTASAPQASGSRPGGLRVLDVSDPAQPRLVGSLDLANASEFFWAGGSLDVHFDRAYVVSQRALHVIDVSRGSSPKFLASYDMPPSAEGYRGGRVRVRGDLAYVVAHGIETAGKLAVYRVGARQGSWTPWYNTDQPSGAGDGEHLATLVQKNHVCETPIDIECRRSYDERDWSMTGENMICLPWIGAACLNGDQVDLNCDDYEVRFFCGTRNDTPADN